MPSYARISCLTPVLISIFLISCTNCGNNNAEIEFYLNTDENTVAANHLLSRANEYDLNELHSVTMKYPHYKSLLLVAIEAEKIVEDFNNSIEAIRHEIINIAAGSEPNPWDNSIKPRDRIGKNYKNKKIAADYFLSDKNNRGIEIKNKIITTRRQIFDLIDTSFKKIPISIALIKPEEVEDLKKHISLGAEESFSKSEKGNDWAYTSFHQVPLVKALAILSSLQSQAIISGSMVINFMGVHMYKEGCGFDCYEPVSSPELGYATMGEKFKTDIFMAATGDEIISESIVIKVNGKTIPVNQGIGHYEVRAKKAGENIYRADITMIHPITNKTETYSKTFRYYVGGPSE